MSKARLTLCGMLAVFAVSMLTASVASAAGPFWHVNGAKLVQGSKGIKLQSKSPVGFGWETLGIRVFVICGRSTSDGTIDGQGPTKQGQDKGTFTFEQCNVVTEPVIAGCNVVQPIKTNQLKTHLALATVQGQEQIVDLIEAATSQQTGNSWGNITLINCGVLNGTYPIRGSLVGALAPQEAESQEMSLYFSEVITTIKHEGQESSVRLTIGANAAVFSGFYGARLQNGERFGVFRN